MSTVNVNVNTQGLSDVLAALIDLQSQMRAVGRAARSMQSQVNSSSNSGSSNSGSSNSGSSNSGSSTSSVQARIQAERALSDSARRESSAIVAAYAEIASSAFALAAAFSILAQSAQYGDMLAAQDKFASKTATNMQTVAKTLQSTTKYAINFQEAAQFASIGRLAGFTTDQVKKLATIGTSAATILGRDVPDALSRMFRGVAKGEPELLDELGIFIRLDNAYKAYVQTIAKGQRVIDLTAAQRRQATFYAAEAAGKPMTDGNSDAQINLVIQAQANFTNALKDSMLVVSNTVGPALLWLSNNLTAMAALAALIGGNTLKNLGNILVNQTKASAALQAAQTKWANSRELSSTLWGNTKDRVAALTTQTRLNTLQAESRAADTNHQKAMNKYIKEYQRARSQEIQQKYAMGIMDAAQAKAASKALKERIAQLKASPQLALTSANNMLNATSPAAIGAASGLIAAAAAATNAAAAANGRLALSFTNVGAVGVTAWNAIVASANLAWAATVRVGAAIQFVTTKFMGFGMALLGPVGIGFALYSLGKMGLESIGLLNKSLSELEEELENVNSRLEKTFSNFQGFGKFNVNDISKGIQTVEYLGNIFDSTSTEVTNLVEKLKSDKLKETWLDKMDLSNATENMTKFITLLNSADKAKLFESVDIAAIRNQVDSKSKNELNFGGGIPKAQDIISAGKLATSSIGGFTLGLEKGIVPFETYKTVMIAMQPLLAEQAKGFKIYGDNIKQVVESTSLFSKAYNSLADTLRSESSFNEPIAALQGQLNSLKVVKDNIEGILNQPGINPDVVLGVLNTQIATLNDMREKMGGKLLPAFDNVTDIQSATAAIMEYTKQTEANVKAHFNRTNAIRTATIAMTKQAEAYDRTIANMSTGLKAKGLDVSSLTALTSKLNRLKLEGRINKETASYLKDFDNLAMSRSTQIALKDYARELGFKNKEAADVLEELRLSIPDISKELFNIPLSIDFKSALEDLEPFRAKITENFSSTLADIGLAASAARDTLKGLLLEQPERYATGSYNKAIGKAKDDRDNFTDLEKEANLLAELGKIAEQNASLMGEYNKALESHNKNVAELNKLMAEQWGRSRSLFSGYDVGLDKLKLLTDAYRGLANESTMASRELQVYMQTLDSSTAKKVAELEAKLRSDAIGRGEQQGREDIDKLKSGSYTKESLGSDAVASAYLDQSNLIRELNRQETVDKTRLASETNKLRTLENALIEERIKAALEQVDITKLQANEIKRLRNETMKLEEIKAKSNAVTNVVDGALSSIFGGSSDPIGEIKDNARKEVGSYANLLSKNQTKKGLTDGKDKLLEFFKKEDKAGNSIAKQFSATQEKFTGKIKELVGEKAFSGLQAAVPGLMQAVSGKTDLERKQGLGNAIGSGIGTLFGPIGGAIGGMIGTVAGNYFGKKLKDSGVVASVTAAGKVAANTYEIYKKGSLSGTKTITQVGSSLEASAISALQNVATSTRKNYETNILRMNQMTGNAFNLTLNQLSEVFEGKYSNGSGEQSQEELLKDFAKGYGNFLGKNQLLFLEQFKDITESLTDTLARIVNTMTTANNTFKSAFGAGLGDIVDLSTGYVDRYAEANKNDIAKGFQTAFNSFYAGNRRVYEAVGHLSNTYGSPKDMYGTRADIGIFSNLEALLKIKPSDFPIADSYQYFRRRGDGDAYRQPDKTMVEDMGNLPTIASDYFTDVSRVINEAYLKQFLAADKIYMLEEIAIFKHNRNNANKIKQLALQDFTDRVAKTFEGKDIAEKTAAYNEAMNKYASSVTSSIINTSHNVVSLIDRLNAVNAQNLPTGLSAVRNGLLVPIQVFNRDLRKAISEGAEPEKVAEAIKLGNQLSDAISGILESFSSISLNNVKDFKGAFSSIFDGITDTFKNSAIDSFKKSLLAPLLQDMNVAISGTATSIGGVSNFKSSMSHSDYELSSKAVIKQAQDMMAVLSNNDFGNALSRISVDFENLMKVFDKGATNLSPNVAEITKGIDDIIKSLKENAYSFSVFGNEYSVSLFKAREAFVAAGLSADLANKPIAETFQQLKNLAYNGSITSDNLTLVNEALQSMASASIAARDELVSVMESSKELNESATGYIENLTKDIISDSESLNAAKAALEGLMLVSKDKLTAAKTAYDKSKAIGNSLDYNEKAKDFVSTLESNVQQQIDANTTLMNLAKDKFEKEKAQLDTLTTIIEDLASFMKELKFDEQLSTLKPVDRLNEAELSFNQLKDKVLKEAAAGTFDPKAMATIREDAKQLLTLGRDVFASGDEYTSLYNEVNGLLGSLSAEALGEVKTYEESTKLYQDMALDYAQQTRDLQLQTVSELRAIAQSSAVDNAISVDLVNALRYNQGLPQGLQLSDYYKNLFSSAQSGGTVFTTPNTGYPQFEGIGQYNLANTQQKDLNAQKLTQVLDNLTLVLANLPVDVKNAVNSTNNLVTRRS